MTRSSARYRSVITMRLSQIRDFLAVVESGGIRAAARELGVSQPAITRSVRGREAELHTRLLQRTPTGVVPTQAGRAFLARARAAQAELRKAEEEADRLGQVGVLPHSDRVAREYRHAGIPCAPSAERVGPARFSPGNPGGRIDALVHLRYVHARRYSAHAARRSDGKSRHCRGARAGSLRLKARTPARLSSSPRADRVLRGASRADRRALRAYAARGAEAGPYMRRAFPRIASG